MKRKFKNIIYRFVDALTLKRGISKNINGIRIKFPAKWSRYFESNYEAENVAFIKEQCKEEMTIIDIGAHLGVISLTIAEVIKGKGKIYAFEPTPSTFKTLTQIVALNNRVSTILCINKAVAEKEGTVSFFIDNNEGSNANSLVQKNERTRSGIKISTINIDQFVISNEIKQIDFIKIDAEGTELAVLKGGIKTLQQHQPKLILAIHPRLIKNNGDDINEIYQLLISLNYTIIYNRQVVTETFFVNHPDFFDVHLIPQKN